MESLSHSLPLFWRPVAPEVILSQTFTLYDSEEAFAKLVTHLHACCLGSDQAKLYILALIPTLYFDSSCF